VREGIVALGENGRNEFRGMIALGLADDSDGALQAHLADDPVFEVRLNKEPRCEGRPPRR